MYKIINEVHFEINGARIKFKKYMGQPVVTFADVDGAHGRAKGTAHRNFKANRERFIEGGDYFKVCADEIRLHKIFDISPKAREDVILLTESGYLMLVKSFTDELSWQVQRQLITGYFRAVQMQKEQVQKQNEYSGFSLSMFANEAKEICGKIEQLSEEVALLKEENLKFKEKNSEFTEIIKMKCEEMTILKEENNELKNQIKILNEKTEKSNREFDTIIKIIWERLPKYCERKKNKKIINIVLTLIILYVIIVKTC